MIKGCVSLSDLKVGWLKGCFGQFQGELNVRLLERLDLMTPQNGLRILEKCLRMLHKGLSMP